MKCLGPMGKITMPMDPKVLPGVRQLMVKTVALGPDLFGIFFGIPLKESRHPGISCGDPNQQLTIG